MTKTHIKACIFDLDGVIVDTAKYHFQAWQQMANALGFDFTHAQNEQLKGVSRMESLELILGWGNKELSQHEKETWAHQKNEWYVELLADMDTNEIIQGVIPFLNNLQEKNILIGLGSSSKNASRILEKVGIMHYFSAIVDGNHLTKSKPDPQVFELGIKALSIKPNQAIVFEDAIKGIDAALHAGAYAVGVGNPTELSNAHMVIPSFNNWSFDKIVAELANY